MVGSPGNSNCLKLYFSAVASGGGGKVARTKEAIKDFILKYFVKRHNTIKVNSVENTVHTMTKILLSHLGNKGFSGILFAVSFLVEILFPFLSILSIKTSKSIGWSNLF